MELTFWKEETFNRCQLAIEETDEYFYNENGLTLIKGERILSVVKSKNGIKFREENEGWFNQYYSKEDVLKLLDELKWWIENNIE